MRFKKNSKEKTILNIALMGTASFFVIAIAKKFNRLLHFVRNDKKDIVESGIKLLKKLLFDEFEVFIAFLCFDNQHINAAWEFGNVDSGF